MTTLDKTEIETARNEFVHSTTKEQIERWAYKWADDLLSTADALSSLPAQAVGVKPVAWMFDFFHHEPSPRWHGEVWNTDPREQYGDTLVRNVKPLYLAPSQPAAVGERLNDEEKRILGNIKWESVDRDNMEFTARVSCYQLDALNKLLSALRSTP